MKVKRIYRKAGLMAVFVCLTTVAAFAQRFAYVDSEYILKHIPEYAASQKQLDALSAQWQKEVDGRFSSIENMYKSYQQDQSVLSPEMRRRREDEIVQKEKEAKDFQKLKFGFEGDLYKERQKLVKPIQDRIAQVIKSIAATQGLDVVLDKGSEASFLYANPRLDKSNEVITKLGYKVTTVAN